MFNLVCSVLFGRISLIAQNSIDLLVNLNENDYLFNLAIFFSAEEVFGMGDLRRDDYDVWAVEVAMETLERRIKPIVSDAPLSAQTRFNNALLNLAVNRIVAVEGGKFTAGILWRLADAIADGKKPEPGKAVDLTYVGS